mgnify:CR=1 FL=1
MYLYVEIVNEKQAYDELMLFGVAGNHHKKVKK